MNPPSYDDNIEPVLRQTTIRQAAIMTGNLILTMPRPARHPQIIREAAKFSEILPLPNEIQGFMTSNGDFVDRVVAMDIAKYAGQLRYPKTREHSKELFTEDLW